MPDDQDTSTTRLSEGDDRNPEGIVHNLSSPFRFLRLAAYALLEVVYDIRMKAAQAISTATDYDWNAASDRLWSQLQQTRDYYRAVEREVAISGRAVQTVLQLAQATNRTMDFKMGYSGPWPSGDDKPMGFDEIEAGLAPISPDRRAELRTEIDSQVRLAATKITPRLRSTSEGDVRDFILDLIAVGGDRPLLDNEVKALNDWLEYETDEIPTVRWEKCQIRHMLAKHNLAQRKKKEVDGSGPIPGNRFVFNGNSHDVSPTIWRLINAMWGKEIGDAFDVQDEVWDDHPPENGLRNELSRTKTFLESIEYPRYISKVRRDDTLVWKEFQSLKD